MIRSNCVRQFTLPSRDRVITYSEPAAASSCALSSTASIFPESPAAYDDRTVLGVHGCPKPPPSRISLGFAALTAAREVWMVVSGEDKAAAVALALSGAGQVQVPAVGAQGRQQTLWLLDEAAASRLPRGLRRL